MIWDGGSTPIFTMTLWMIAMPRKPQKVWKSGIRSRKKSRWCLFCKPPPMTFTQRGVGPDSSPVAWSIAPNNGRTFIQPRIEAFYGSIQFELDKIPLHDSEVKNFVFGTADLWRFLGGRSRPRAGGMECLNEHRIFRPVGEEFPLIMVGVRARWRWGGTGRI